MARDCRLNCGTVRPLRGRVDTRRWVVPALIVAGASLLVGPLASGAGRPGTIDRLRADDASLAAASHTALLDLYSLDTQLASAQSRLGALERQAGELRSRRASIGRQLRLARLDARISQNRLAQRVRFIYDHGNTSTLELLLGARSLDEALTQLDGVNRVASANQDVLAQVTSAQHQLVRLSHSLALRCRSPDRGDARACRHGRVAGADAGGAGEVPRRARVSGVPSTPRRSPGSAPRRVRRPPAPSSSRLPRRPRRRRRHGRPPRRLR